LNDRKSYSENQRRKERLGGEKTNSVLKKMIREVFAEKVTLSEIVNLSDFSRHPPLVLFLWN
jgi:hypothetical protein